MIPNHIFRIEKKLIVYFLLLLIYRVLIDWSYYYAISPSYNYMGLITSISLIRMVESYILTIFIIIITPKNEKRFSSIFLNIQMVIFLIPMLSLYGLAHNGRLFIYTVCFCHIIQFLLFKSCPNIKIKHIKTKYYKLLTFIIIISIVALSVLLVIKQFEMPTFAAMNLNNVYNIREQNVTTFPLSYLIPWMERIILPFIAIYSLKYKKYIVFILAAFLQLYFYLIFAQKYYLFALVMTTGVYFLKKFNLLMKGMYVGFPILVLSTTSLFLYDNKYIMLPSLFVRRVLIVPANLKFVFYEFFSKNPKVYLADGMVGRLFGINSPYDRNIPYVISNYMNVPDAAYNTGYWGDAYANLGIFGVVLFSILLAFIIYFVERKTKKIDLAIVVACFSLPLYSLNDSALLTMLLTGGLLLLIMIFAFFSMKKNSN